MEPLKKLPREVQAVLGGAALYVVFSFLDWQQVSAFGITAGISEWHGIGVVAALLAVAVLCFELVRLVQPRFELGSISAGLVSYALAVALLVFTVLTFLTHNEARHWPAWIGLILAVVIAGAASRRARNEEVRIPFSKPPRPTTPAV